MSKLKSILALVAVVFFIACGLITQSSIQTKSVGSTSYVDCGQACHGHSSVLLNEKTIGDEDDDEPAPLVSDNFIFSYNLGLLYLLPAYALAFVAARHKRYLQHALLRI